MTAEEIYALASGLKRRLEEQPYSDLRYWCLSPQQHTCAPPQGDFHLLHLLDLLNGCEPVLLDRAGLQAAQPPVAFSHTILLDSSAATWLAAYANGNLINPKPKRSVESFLEWFARTNHDNGDGTYDFNLFSYLLEAVLHGAKQERVVDTLAALQVLQTFDYQAYLDRHEIVVNIERVHPVVDQFRTSDFKRIAEMRWSMISPESLRAFKLGEDLIYLLLLKLAGIELTHPSWSFPEKLDVFCGFLDECSTIVGMVLLLGVAYFAGFFRGFFGTEKSDRRDTLSTLRRSAGDLNLLEQPAALLHYSRREHTPLGYILTADQLLWEWGRYLSLESVHSENGAYASQVNIKQSRAEHSQSLATAYRHLEGEKARLMADWQSPERMAKRLKFLRDDLYPMISKLEKTILELPPSGSGTDR